MRFGIRDITDVVFKARTETKIGKQKFKAGQPVLYIDTAKTATLEGAATTVYAQGGRGNPRLVAWEGERTITFTLEDSLLSPVSFAMLTGAGLANVSTAESANKVKVNTWFDLPIVEGGKVIIDLETAGDNHDIYVDQDGDFPVYGTILDNAGAPVVYCDLATNGIAGVGPNCKVYTITKDHSLELTFSGADKYVGKTLRVDCYVEKTGGVTEINIDAENFAGNYYVEAQTFFREEYSAVDMPVVLTIPNVKIQSNFTFNMNNSGDPSTFTFTMDAFPAYVKGDRTKKVFASIDIVADENIHPDVADVEESDTSCKDLELHFSAVTAGAEDGTALVFTDDPKKVKYSDLGNSLAATIDRANIDFTGNLKRIDNWTAFQQGDSTVALTGYYVPFTVEVPEEGYSIVYNGKEIKFGTTDDSATKMKLVWAVDPDNPVVSISLKKGEKTQDISVDFSKMVFK